MPAKRIPRRSLFIPPPASLVNIWIRSRRLHLLRSVGSAADLGRIPSVLLSFGCNSGWVFRVPWGSAPTQCHAGLLLLGEHRAAEGSQRVWVTGEGGGGGLGILQPAKEGAAPTVLLSVLERSRCCFLDGAASRPFRMRRAELCEVRADSELRLRSGRGCLVN